MFDIYIKQALILIIVISGIPLVVSSAISLLISILQAATQIQEQSITFLAKFVAVSSMLFICAQRFEIELVDFFQVLLRSIALYGKF